MSQSNARATFFKQSGWMAFAAIAGGAFNMGANFVAQRLPKGDFNTFDTALSALAILTIPAYGMQGAFAAQAAGADSDGLRRDLAATARMALMLLGAVWIALAGWWLFRQESIMAAYKLTQPLMLGVLLLLVLVTLWTPVPNGILQGRQDFLWFGWATLLNGALRFSVLWLVVQKLKYGAMGGLLGVLAGSGFVLGLVTWRTWSSLMSSGAFRIDWRAWLRRLVPVTIGLGALSFMMQFDAIAVRGQLIGSLTLDEADGFSAVRKIGQALVFVVGALTSVMYPKVARSFQKSEPSDLLKVTLLLTALIAVGGGVLATVFPKLPLQLLSPERLHWAKVLVPGYCWALVPMALSNVLVWNLLARECYRSVPWMAALALGCWLCLRQFGDRLTAVICIVAVFNTLLFLTCAVFAWREARRERRV